MRYDEWKNATGSSTMGDRVKKKMLDIIKNHEVPALPADVMKQIDADYSQGRSKGSS
jgi:trimethylamine:corrinoid methyltransferase-like protein